jgi:aminoglycoside phosphotransferase
VKNAVKKLLPTDPLAQALRQLVDPEAFNSPSAGEIYVESLPASRQVLRFKLPEGAAVVGKFFSAYPPEGSADLGLAREYDNYQQLPALGLNNGLVPRLLGRWPQESLGLLLEAVPGPDLDNLIYTACSQGDSGALYRGLENLVHLLVFFHSRPVPPLPLSHDSALAYFDKVTGQLHAAGLLNREDCQALTEERDFWEIRFQDFPDRQVLVHGDATPTNFLFPDGRAVALDLEKMRIGDRLWDLSWVAGELKHAWGWRIQNFVGAEEAISHFFQAYLAATGVAPPFADRLYNLNPFYMALAELRIARNLYLTWDYRLKLVAEARRCLAGGRAI